MTTKNTTQFSLVPLTQTVNSTQTGLSTKEAKKFGAELDRQTLAIHGHMVKAQCAAESISAIREHGVASFTVTTGHMQAICQQADPRVKPLVNDFTDRQSEALGNNILGIAEISARKIAGEVARELYQQAEEPKHWWQK